MDFSEFTESVNGKKIDVVGIGISNLPLISLLHKNGAIVTALDKRTREQLGDTALELEKKGIRIVTGENYLDSLTGEIIFKTPGLRFDAPQLLDAKERGAKITSEMEVFCSVCPAHIIAITGSDGKTTTTTLIGKMLEAADYKVWVGGNIGTPLLSLTNQMTPDDYVVLELSSFQLHTMNFSPEVAVVTNISPNHLDMHKDYAEYIDAKKNIFINQKPGSRLILNLDNSVTSQFCGNGETIYFSRYNSEADIYIKNNEIVYKGDPVLNVNDIKIPGMHNVENYMAAIGAVGSLVSQSTIMKIAKSFGGVEHRIELVRTVNGVKYYNSSIDSSPNRTINTLSVFDKKVIMISGGKDKGIPYDSLGAAIAEHVKTLILIGATSDKILKSLNDEINRTGNGVDVTVFHASAYREAVQLAAENAQPGDVVLLSPASTSFDMFKNFEERGKLFKDIVNELK